MARPLNFLAVDLGAESGRCLLGTLENERLRLTESHRFPNGPVALPDGLHWDVLRLWHEIVAGIGRAGHAAAGGLAGIGLDAWGVDFGLLDAAGGLIGNPFHYRDGRTEGMIAEACRRLPRAEVFRRTGIQVMPINSLYQLLAMVVRRAPALDAARTFLTIPDLFNYWLTGRAVCEFTNATTTQCYDPSSRAWSVPILEAMGIPLHIFPEVVRPGTVLGALSGPAAAAVAGAQSVPVVAPACHDTGSAVAAVPMEAGAPSAWISSGTWSVLGTELDHPVIDAAALAGNFTNEGGVGGTFRFSKNVTALWLVQECRRTWAAQGEEYSYDELVGMAGQAPPLAAVIDPDDARFAPPGDMPARIRAYCGETGQPMPETQGAVVRCALESIALKYRWVLERLEGAAGVHFDTVYIVGGGTQNRLLSQCAADATGRRVVIGPVEATAMGNVLVQAMALGHIASLADARRIVRNSTELQVYEPGPRAAWDDAYARLSALASQSQPG